MMNENNTWKKPVKYTQDWPSYDRAKTNEDVLFKRMLSELLLMVAEEPKIARRGRRGYSLRDKILCMCIKVYYKSDLRKAQSILKECRNLGLIQQAPCFKSIDNFFNDESLCKLLDDLILASSLPLAGVEETGAIDATGFSTSQWERWFKYKWGKHEGKERVWRKAHACGGCKTNTIISIKVTESNVGDSTMFEEVVGNRPKYFNMQDFVADKAYLSREILQFIQNLGLMPYIPFKKNSIGLPKGYRIWRKMWHEFQYNQEDFMKHYHKRSNIETCFSMIKKKFGNHCMTKNFKANVNEIKTKALCHNICVLIQEVFELGIDLDFKNCAKIACSV